MARYRWRATVPPGTTEEDAIEATIELDDRQLQDGLIFTPPGSAGRVNAVLLWGEVQLLPTPESSPTVLPGTTDAAPLNVRVTGEPYVLTLRVWAPTAVESHTVTARVDATEPGADVQLVRVVGGGSNVVTAGTGPSVSAQDLRDVTDE
jgi:hypothetical protein